MLSRPRTFPSGFIPPCLPTKAPRPPSGAVWLHEIKHDGFRVIARKDGKRVKLFSRPGNDLTWRFSLIVEALSRLRSRSCIIDGEAVACDDSGEGCPQRATFPMLKQSNLSAPSYARHKANRCWRGATTPLFASCSVP